MPLTEEDLADLLRQHASGHQVPGAALGIIRDGVPTIGWYGVADVRTAEPVSAASRFGVGSLTKSMVATVVARLTADGRLSLDDPLAAHVPELRSASWAEHPTVRDFLANRSGLPLRAAFEFDVGDDRSDDEVLSRLAASVAVQEPTAVDWSYTNVGWCLVGRAIETVTRSVWEEAMHAELLSPAQLRETTFATLPDGRVAGHRVTADGPVPVEPLVARAYGPSGLSAVSTVGDLLRFAALHLEDPVLAGLRSRQPAPRICGWLDGWCLGWGWFDWDGGRVWGWDSVLPGERALLRLVPDRRAAVVLMTNSDNGRALYRSVFPPLMQALFGMGVPPLCLDEDPSASSDLTRFSGLYGWPDRRVEVVASERCLLIRSERGETEARPIDDRTFVVNPLDPDNPAVTFSGFDAAGRPRLLYVMLWALPRLRDEQAV